MIYIHPGGAGRKGRAPLGVEVVQIVETVYRRGQKSEIRYKADLWSPTSDL